MNQDNAPSSPPAPSLDQSVDDQALHWYLALREEGAQSGQASLQAQFEQWLAQDPRHRAAFDACKRDWAVLDGVRQHFQRNPARSAAVPHRLRLRFAVWSASLAMALAAAGLAWQMHAYADFSLLGARSFVTPLHQSAALAMRDGTQMDLDVNTTLTVAYSAEQRDITLVSGSLFVDVARDPQRPFVIHTDQGTVQVLGTAFEVQRLPDGLRVNVARGHVQVTGPAHGETMDLTAGQSVRLRQRGFGAVQAIDPRQVAAWRQDRLVFDQDTLADVAHAINRRSAWTVHVDAAARRLPVTLAMQLDDVVNALQALPDVLPVTVVRSGRIVTIAARDPTLVEEAPRLLRPRGAR